MCSLEGSERGGVSKCACEIMREKERVKGGDKEATREWREGADRGRREGRKEREDVHK